MGDTYSMDRATPVIQAEGLRFHHGDASSWKLEIPRLALLPGQHAYIHGPSGCGKTTLLQLIAGVLPPREGSVTVLGETLSQGRNRDRRRTELMGFVFQGFNLVPYLSALENVMLPCRFATKRRARVKAKGVSLADEAGRLLEQLAIDRSLGNRLPEELSVGQQQRVAVARALIGQPPLIICDEPTSALDPHARDRFVELLLQECADAGSTAIVVSHDPAIRASFSLSFDLSRMEQTSVLRSVA